MDRESGASSTALHPWELGVCPCPALEPGEQLSCRGARVALLKMAFPAAPGTDSTRQELKEALHTVNV